jgi:hypothetical protein
LASTNPRLAESWAKLDWAKGHVDRLRGGLGELADGELHLIELRREYDTKRGAFVYRVGSRPKIPDNAGFVVGDAVQNFRSCLNYVAWQLAIDPLGREPNEGEARNVQFPILSREKAHLWPDHPHRRFMSDEAANAIKKFQPFDVEAESGPEWESALSVLAALSNDDKHKALQVVIFAPARVHVMLAKEGPAPGVVIAGQYREGDEVASIPVPPDEPPDVDKEPKLFGQATIGEHRWAVIPALDGIGATCAQILAELDPVLKTRG